MGGGVKLVWYEVKLVPVEAQFGKRILILCEPEIHLRSSPSPEIDKQIKKSIKNYLVITKEDSRLYSRLPNRPHFPDHQDILVSQTRVLKEL